MSRRVKVSSHGEHGPPQSIINTMPARHGFSPLKLISLLLVIAVLATGGLYSFRLLRPSVVVTRLVEGPVIRAVYATGTISPEREFPVRATNEGTLETLFVDKGSVVQSGDRLAQIVDPALIYSVDMAAADLNEKLARADEKSSPVLAELDARITASTQQLEIAQREERRLREAF